MVARILAHLSSLVIGHSSYGASNVHNEIFCSLGFFFTP